MTGKNGGYRNVNSNCGSWVSSLCRTITPVSSVGTEVTRQGIRKERGMWYGEIQDKRTLSLSWWGWPAVQAATLTTAPTPLDSDCREAEGSCSSCGVPRSGRRCMKYKHAWPYTNLPSINTTASLPPYTSCTNASCGQPHLDPSWKGSSGKKSFSPVLCGHNTKPPQFARIVSSLFNFILSVSGLSLAYSTQLDFSFILSRFFYLCLTHLHLLKFINFHNLKNTVFFISLKNKVISVRRLCIYEDTCIIILWKYFIYMLLTTSPAEAANMCFTGIKCEDESVCKSHFT